MLEACVMGEHIAKPIPAHPKDAAADRMITALKTPHKDQGQGAIKNSAKWRTNIHRAY